MSRRNRSRSHHPQRRRRSAPPRIESKFKDDSPDATDWSPAPGSTTGRPFIVHHDCPRPPDFDDDGDPLTEHVWAATTDAGAPGPIEPDASLPTFDDPPEIDDEARAAVARLIVSEHPADRDLAGAIMRHGVDPSGIAADLGITMSAARRLLTQAVEDPEPSESPIPEPSAATTESRIALLREHGGPEAIELADALEQSEGDVDAAAAILEISPRTFYRRLKTYR